MTQALDGPRLKNERARSQLNELSVQINEFLNGQPYVSFIEVDEEHRRVSLGVEVRQRPDLSWGVLMGEILHNLRSSLDHAFWQLVASHGGKPHERTAFPIFLREDGFDAERQSRGRRRGMCDGLSASNFSTIKS